MNAILNFLRDSGTKIRTTHPLRQLVAFALFALLATCAFVGTVVKPDSTRVLYYFPDTFTQKDSLEIRHIPRLKSPTERFRLYLDEMLLGPVHQDRLALFPPTVRVTSAFIRGRDAYVNLSSQAVDTGDESLRWADVYRVFKKNVFTNFRNIARIYIYIDGQEVYAEEPPLDAKTKK